MFHIHGGLAVNVVIVFVFFESSWFNYSRFNSPA